MYQREVKTFEQLKALPEWQHVDDQIKPWFKKAYNSKYHMKSDGISWISQFTFTKSPPGVLHDYLYAKAPMTRKQADLIFRDALTSFGYPKYARIYYRGLRMFGWYAWMKHRRNQRRAKKKRK